MDDLKEAKRIEKIINKARKKFNKKAGWEVLPNKVKIEFVEEAPADARPAKPYRGCKSLLCKQCKHYQKFLMVSTMQSICWNKGCTFEETEAPSQADAKPQEPQRPMFPAYQEQTQPPRHLTLSQPPADATPVHLCTGCTLFDDYGGGITRCMAGLPMKRPDGKCYVPPPAEPAKDGEK